MLALVTDAFGGRGGIAQYNRDFLGALAETGALSSITVLPRQAPDLFVLPARIEQTPARPGRIGYSVAALRTALLRPVDLIFCGHLFMAPLAALIARLRRAKLIVQTHGIEAWSRPSKAQRSALEEADLVLCVSRHTRASVLSWAAIAPERVLVVPDTVRDAFTPGGGSTQRAGLGLEGKRVLLTVGRMDPHERYKGHDRVITAIPSLVANGYNICYLVVGEGADRIRLESVARDAGVSERVRFLCHVGLQTLVEIYRMADLFVMPSTGEGFGVAFLEAMASGTPALGLGVAGARDALADGQLGTLVAEDGFSDAIARLLAALKPDSRALAAAARARFGRESFAASVHAALNRLREAA
ncbi:MAG: glycosyltransferase family 4 protein [Candidatus Sulfotelmatobacter sp.]